jgi:FixJ family two-component response regulator
VTVADLMSMGIVDGRIKGVRSPFSQREWMTAAMRRRTPRVRWNLTAGSRRHSNPHRNSCLAHAPLSRAVWFSTLLFRLNGLDLQKRVAVDRTDMPIIFITGYGDVPTTVQAMKAGAVEFLTKPFGDYALLSAIRQALERSRIALAHDAEIRELRDRYASLSRREREVMALVVRGLLNKQVAFELGISETTVKAHRGKTMCKMAADSLADLVTMAASLRAALARHR